MTKNAPKVPEIFEKITIKGAKMHNLKNNREIYFMFYSINMFLHDFSAVMDRKEEALLRTRRPELFDY